MHLLRFILISTSDAIALFSNKSLNPSNISLGLTLIISPPEFSTIFFKISISLSESSKVIKEITTPFSFAIFPIFL